MIIERLGSLVIEPRLIKILTSCAHIHPMEVQHHPSLAGVPVRMRDLAPEVLGPTQRWQTVLLGCGTEQGNSQDEHAHEERVLMYYPHATEVEVEGAQVPVGEGEVIYIPPGLRHAVRRVSRPRLSVAVVIP